ncbi:MAG: hypothetical protein HGA26_05140, partial [Chlorobiaceae bacterium]|nr:hypothetical protein [Chlorobiaceae bacterium]
QAVYRLPGGFFQARGWKEQLARKPVDRLDLLREILSGIYSWRAVLHEGVFHSTWDERIAFKGEWVSLENAAGEEALQGQVVGLDDSGSLVLRTLSGKNVCATVGDLKLRPFQ